MQQRPRILDVGCGHRKATDSIGIDVRRYPGVDIVHDLEVFPWPLESDRFDLVICSHIIEHIHNVPRFLKEIHRLCTDGADVRIDTPHFSSLDSWTDPSHRQHLALHSFDFFVADGYLNNGAVFEVVQATLTFRKALTSRLGALLFRWSPRRYEQNLAYLLPARDIKVALRAVKGPLASRR
ncbi:MAG TPA: methyltransferase domain-containing protein [Candidatus Acidoferrales bacterium]|nr:methyltransferase domain-containing protein [Candidatus Acidoferrales bacterium]